MDHGGLLLPPAPAEDEALAIDLIAEPPLYHARHVREVVDRAVESVGWRIRRSIEDERRRVYEARLARVEALHDLNGYEFEESATSVLNAMDCAADKALDWFKQDQPSGRVPKNIEFELAQIPAELGQRLEEARAQASKEVTSESYAETSAPELIGCPQPDWIGGIGDPYRPV